MGFFKDWLMKGVDIEENEEVSLNQKAEIAVTTIPEEEVKTDPMLSLQELKNLAEREQQASVELASSHQNAQMQNSAYAQQIQQPYVAPMQSAQQSPLNMQTNSAQKQEFKVIKVGSNLDIQVAIRQLQHNNACVISYMHVSKKELAKLKDFLNGAVFALNATIHPLKNNSYIIAPSNIEIKPQDKVKRR